MLKPTQMTPNTALGGNTCIESVAVLANKLHATLTETKAAAAAGSDGDDSSSSRKKPTAAALEQALAAYQAERLERVRQIVGIARGSTRMEAWASPWLRFLVTRVVPRLPDRYFADQLSEVISAAPKLDFLDAAGFPSGRVPWKDDNAAAPGPAAGNGAVVESGKGGALAKNGGSGNGNSGSGVGLLLSAATAFVLLLYYAFRFLLTPRP